LGEQTGRELLGVFSKNRCNVDSGAVAEWKRGDWKQTQQKV